MSDDSVIPKWLVDFFKFFLFDKRLQPLWWGVTMFNVIWIGGHLYMDAIYERTVCCCACNVLTMPSASCVSNGALNLVYRWDLGVNCSQACNEYNMTLTRQVSYEEFESEYLSFKNTLNLTKSGVVYPI